MGAGDHEHGHYALDCEAPRSTEEWPDDGGDGGGDDGDDREVKRRPVRQGLSARARRLRLLDEPHDARERGLVAGSPPLDPQRALSVHGAGYPPVTERTVAVQVQGVYVRVQHGGCRLYKKKKNT